MALPSPTPEPAGVLLDQVLGSLLADFSNWFGRGLVLLDSCPDAVMGMAERQELRQKLELAIRELAAATSLRQATPAPMALEMATLAPWHQLVLSVWQLSANLRRAGVALPEMEPLPQPPGFA
ncbi:DUF2605 domain-containing protein [Cyanobium sp. WAJ14-Wanaka]|uniref:DUF2605 domain-containing protein n=1 Tax=Cyanobium sp. WAJ14-Wanaka TaxID=2823725 RepID=UPI0020CBA045|nr:DUF2605 domain-containing protein [Cyanobium sp. WAJ14-Wanaka]MCP9774690.1 DUF2605 domain-containing protein [Cyanobium sp. WAJ14-Wanaka]